MSHPALPTQAEPQWPLAALADIASSTATILGASRVWIVLRDGQGRLIPRIAYTSDETGAALALNPTQMPAVIARTVGQLGDHPSPDTPLALTDLHAARGLQEMLGPDAAEMRALAAAPLLRNGVMIGALIVTTAKPGGMSDRRRLMLSTFAKLATAAIEMTGAAEREAAQSSELDALLRASQALTSTLDADQLIQAIVESIQKVITCDSALIYQSDERKGVMRVIAAMGEETERLKGDTVDISSDSRVGWVARTRHTYEGVVRPEDRIGAHTDALREGHAVSLLCMPLISKNTLRGAISLARQLGFTPRERDMMERLTPIAAAALENVELFQQSQAERQQLEALFASASDGIALLDDQLRFVQVNPAFARYIAADHTALLGRPCCEALSAANDGSGTPGSCLLCHTESECLLRQVLKNERQLEHAECVFPPLAPPLVAREATDGPLPSARTIDFSLTPMRGPKQGQRVLLVGRDVSGQRDVERFRAEQIQLVTHEIGTPLQTVVSHMELFLRLSGQQIAPEHRDWLNTALTTAVSLRALMDDLEVITRKDARQWKISPQRMNLYTVVREVATEQYLAAQQQGVTLRLSPEAQAPEAMADPARARQVARNLISNAIKFTPAGGRISVSLGFDEQWVILQVKDTGIGVPADIRSKIWERFYRAPQVADAKIAGQGLGLANVRSIMNAHKGKCFQGENPGGQGSVFTVAFPRADRLNR